MSTISGGVTFSQFSQEREETVSFTSRVLRQRRSCHLTSFFNNPPNPKQVNPSLELNVLKSVLLREGYLRRLSSMSAASTHVLQPGLGDLLDILRIASVEVVENIAEWRKGLTKPTPFMWNGINYLVKMPSDLDFLNKLKPLTKWLGFSMERNPFVIPLAMENRPGTAKGAGAGGVTKNGELLTGHSTKEGVNADPGFTSIGGTLSSAAITTSTQDIQTSPSRKGTKKKQNEITPYTTPVINDPSLITSSTSNRKSPTKGPKSSTSSSTNYQQHVTPSTIGDLDLLRIRRAEKAILSEEAIQGQYLRDASDRLVPAWQAERERFGEVVGTDDHRPLSKEARIMDRDMAPFAETSGFGLDPMQPGDVDDDKAASSIFSSSARSGNTSKKSRRSTKKRERVEAPQGASRANKIGGELHAITTAGTAGRKKAPSRRSRGAILEMDITRKQRENEELERQLGEMKSDLKVALGALEDMEREAAIHEDEENETRELNEAATVIQSEIRQVEAKTRVAAVKKRREEIELAKREVLAREKELEIKTRDLKEKEEQRKYFKQVEKRSQDARRARELERKRRKLDENTVLPEDEEEAITLEDVSATSIQRISRGRQARKFYRDYREICERASTILQGGARGMFDRKIVRERRLEQWASTTIKRLYRGRLARMEFQHLLAERIQSRAATKIQTYMRGKFGRGRMLHKRALVTSAQRAANSVSVRQLFPADLQELADAIQTPLVDLSKPYLPAAVLGLIKTVCLMLGAEKKQETMAHYDRIGVRTVVPIDKNMTWESAMKVLRRSSKLLRRMRALAAGPANRRPRLLHLPPDAIDMFKAYEHDPSFTLEQMRRIGKGAKAVSQLLIWCTSLCEVFDYQLEFLDDIGDVQPGWLQKLREQQREKRKVLVQLEVRSRALAVAGDSAARSKAAGKAFGTSKVVMIEEGKLKKTIEDELARTQFAQDVQEKKELNEEERITTDAEGFVAEAERNVTTATNEYKKAETEANLGSELDRNRLPKLRSQLIEKEVILRDAKTQLHLCVLRSEKDAKKRESSKLKLDGELLYRCSALGEAEALYKIAKEEKKAFAGKHGGLKALPSLKGRDKEEFLYIDKRIETAKERVVEMEKLLKENIELFELETKKKYDSEAMADAAPEAWDQPTEEEIEEDRREDENMAREEKDRMKEFLDASILADTAKRPRPLLLCIARDVPMAAKQKLLHRVLSDLEGMFVRVSLSENQGVDVNAFQMALDAGSSIIADVDVGICESSRSTFLHSIAVAKKALVPNPMCIVCVANQENRKGNGAEVHLGAAESDLRVMRDGDMKRRLQIASHCLKILVSESVRDEMVDLSMSDGPPTHMHVIVMEAAIILLSPKNRFRHPDKNVASVSWQASKRLLGDVETFQKELRSVDKFSIPDENLVVLQQYLAHEDWPNGNTFNHTTNLMLATLLDYVVAVVEFAAMLRAGGGRPEVLTRRNPLNLFSTVVTMTDALSVVQEDDESAKIGWKAAYSQLVSPLLEDVRVFREARNINGDIHTVNVYMDCNRIFFGAYNPTSSVNYTCSIHIREINALLAPNSIERNEFGPRAPPQTREEMFSRLVHLLVLEKQSRLLGYRKTLACKRALKRILRETRRISGHLATITVSEDSLGELRCQAYLPQFSADLELIVRDDLKFNVLPNTDKLLEAEQFRSDDAMVLLRPVTDRLTISPRLRTIVDMGMDPTRRDADLSKRFGTQGGKKGDKGKGLFLTMRMKGGCSRDLFTCIHNLSGIPHIVTVGEVGRGGMLRVRAYNPASCEQHELRLSVVDRALVIGGSSGDFRLWCDDLLKRLSLRRISKSADEDRENSLHIKSARMNSFRGDTRLDFNRTIFKTAQKLGSGPGAKMFGIRVTMAGFVDVGDSIEIRCVNLESSEEHILGFSEDDMKKIADMGEGAKDVIKTLLSDKSAREAVIREMLRYVKYDDSGDGVSFQSDWMTRAAEKNKSRDVVKLDEGRLKIGGIVKVVATQAVEIDKFDCAVDGGALGVVVVRGRRQAKMNIFESDLGKLPEDCYDEEGEVFEDLYERDKEKGFDYKPLKVLEARSDEKKPDVDADTLLSPTLKFEEIVSESVQLEDGVVDIIEEREKKDKKDGDVVAEEKKGEEGSKSSEAPKDALAMLKERRLIFNQGVKVKHGIVETLSYEVGMVMKVYESYDNAMERTLTLEVYSPSSSAKGVVQIVGDTDLREVVGPHVEELLLPENEEELFYHVAHNRMKIAPGLWNEETETYEKNDENFTVILTRNRLYSHLKQTPVGMGGAQDQGANRDVLIDRRAFRGRKILRKAIKVSGVLLQVQVFEILPVDETPNNAPTLRFLAYDPATGNKMLLEVPGECLEEMIVEDKKEDLIVNTANRYALADAMCAKLKLTFPRGLPPELYMPWSKSQQQGFDDSIAKAGRSNRPIEEKSKRSTDLLMRAGFNLQHRDGLSTFDCIVSVFVHKEVEDALRVNLYVPRIAESCELAILRSEQESVLNGRKAMSYARGEPIQTALGNVIRCLHLHVEDDAKIEKKRNLIATFVHKEGKNWHAAYSRLDPKDAPVNRPSGQNAVVFIPADTRGDLIIRKGIKVSGHEVLVSVSTRAKGESAGHGLIFEAYDPELSVNTTLHVVAGELRRLVNNREELLTDENVFSTVEMLLFKLVLRKGPVGHLIMKLDGNLFPDLFMTDEEKRLRKEKWDEEDRLKALQDEDAKDDIVDSEEEKSDNEEEEDFKYEVPLTADVEKTTSQIKTSGPASVPGSVVIQPGRITYTQGEEEKGEKEDVGKEEEGNDEDGEKGDSALPTMF